MGEVDMKLACFARPIFLAVFLGLFLGLFCLASATPSLAAEEPQQPWTVHVYVENDYFSDTDSDYSSGVKFSLISPDLSTFAECDRLPEWSHEYIERLPFINNPDPAVKRKVEFSLGQDIYTPSNAIRNNPNLVARPYAGWAYFATGFQARTSEQMDTIELQLGMVGPSSFGEDTQRIMHDLLDKRAPKGWGDQLKDEPGLVVIYEHKWQIAPFFSRDNFAMDAITHLGCSLGNVATYANTGFETRLGWNLPNDLGVSLIRPSCNPSVPTGKKTSGYFFAAVNGRAVLQDIFLDGNTFVDSPSVDKKPFVADLAAGVAIFVNKVKVTWTQVYRTKEFDGQAENHDFGSLAVTFFF